MIKFEFILIQVILSRSQSFAMKVKVKVRDAVKNLTAGGFNLNAQRNKCKACKR